MCVVAHLIPRLLRPVAISWETLGEPQLKGVPGGLGELKPRCLTLPQWLPLCLLCDRLTLYSTLAQPASLLKIEGDEETSQFFPSLGLIAGDTDPRVLNQKCFMGSFVMEVHSFRSSRIFPFSRDYRDLLVSNKVN